MNTINFTQDTRFDLFFTKFTNLTMKNGKKIKASKLLFDALSILKKKLQKEIVSLKLSSKEPKNSLSEKEINLNLTVLHVVSRAIENVTPNLEVRKVRVAGSTYSVPAVLSKKKQETLALKWVLESAQKRQKTSKTSFSKCLADEILDASRKMGQARQKRDDLHRLAQMNRAYVRYRWW